MSARRVEGSVQRRASGAAMFDVRIVTCVEPPEPDLDEPALVTALEQRGLRVDVAAWTDPGVDWARTRLTLVRSTWDYFHRVDEFAAWIRSVSAVTALHNPAPVLLANLDKHYMGALEAAGVPVVPSRFVDRGTVLERLPVPSDWSRCVAKPTVSGGSLHTRLLDTTRPDLGWLNARLAERDMMLQPYLESVEVYGERSLIFLGGGLSHVVRKGRRFDVDPESITGPFDALPAEQAVARRCLAVAGAEGLLYARVDVAPSPDGQPLVMELEVTEPSLFLEVGGAVERFADLVAARLPT